MGAPVLEEACKPAVEAEHLAVGADGASPPTEGLPGTRSGTLQWRDMLRSAVGRTKALKGSALEKANLFEREAADIQAASKGDWAAVRGTGKDGAHVFEGQGGEALVINPKGEMFRGSINTTA